MRLENKLLREEIKARDEVQWPQGGLGSTNTPKGRIKKNPDYLMTLIKRVGGYLAEITTSLSLRNNDMTLGWVDV